MAGGVFAEFFALEISAFCQPSSLPYLFLSFDSGVGCGVVLFPECDSLQRKSCQFRKTKRERGKCTLSVSQSFFNVSTSSLVTVSHQRRPITPRLRQVRALTPYVVIYIPQSVSPLRRCPFNPGSTHS
jgi:hypothetical protein